MHNTKAFLNYLSHSPYLNFIILLSGVVISVLLLVSMISFFLSQVILTNYKQYVNDKGTLVFNQPLENEHYMFLLNSATLWADSGIEVIKGDKVQITVSGSFYSDIDELCESAQNNGKPRWNYYPQKEKTDNTLDPNLPFGALLFRIQTPVNSIMKMDSIPSMKVDRNEKTGVISFVAPNSGILYFAVNDIPYFEEQTTDANEGVKANNQSVEHGKDSKKWFNDNCGELLINVKVTRNIAKKSDIPIYDKIFISSMRLFY